MAGRVAMTTTAQKHLIQTLALEVEGTGIKAHKLIPGPVKTRDRLKHGMDRMIGTILKRLANTFVSWCMKPRKMNWCTIYLVNPAKMIKFRVP